MKRELKSPKPKASHLPHPVSLKHAGRAPPVFPTANCKLLFHSGFTTARYMLLCFQKLLPTKNKNIKDRVEEVYLKNVDNVGITSI